MGYPPIVVSDRWLRNWTAASVGVREAVVGATHDLVRRVRADPRTVVRQYDRVAGLSVGDVLEVDLTGSWRMVGVFRKGRVHLFAFGDHDLVPRFVEAAFRACKSTENEAPLALWPDDASRPSFFVSAEGTEYRVIDSSENTREWLYFLSDEQTGVSEEVALWAFDEAPTPVLILGGPGTGKTSVLLSVMASLVDDCGVPPTDIAFSASERVLTYLEQCLPALRIRRFVPGPGDSRPIVLLDDPGSLSAIEGASLGAKYVVAALDPLQLTESATDAEFDDLVERLRARRRQLSVCYRQKEAVAVQTARVIDAVARSSPFLDEGKRSAHMAARARLTAAANEMRLANPGGTVRIIDPATAADVDRRIGELLREPLWRHAPPLLAAIDRKLGESWRLGVHALKNVTHDRVDLQFAGDVKGLEYQHCFVFISRDLYGELTSGFTGVGRPVYESYRMMRIPFSRAKDSLTVFVL